MKTILLNPGPVTLSERVRQAMLRPDLCHRESEFIDLQNRVSSKLLQVYDLDPSNWAAVLLTGSGTAAVEAMLASLVPRSGRLLTIENGVYGERMSDIARTYGIQYRGFHHPWGGAIDVDTVVAGARPGDFVGVVHHETTTGRLNDIGALAGAQRHILLDAVSSFGAEAIDFEGWQVGACAVTANKCLHGVPGTAFVVVRRSLLTADQQPRTLYLDLARYLQAQDRGSTPFTPSVQTLYALDEALDEFEEGGGWRARHAYYRTLMRQLRAGCAALGLAALLKDSESSCVLAAFRLPAGLDYSALHDGLKGHGFIIYAGQGKLAQEIFRIAVMGDIGSRDIDRLLDAIRALLATPRK